MSQQRFPGMSLLLQLDSPWAALCSLPWFRHLVANVMSNCPVLPHHFLHFNGIFSWRDLPERASIYSDKCKNVRIVTVLFFFPCKTLAYHHLNVNLIKVRFQRLCSPPGLCICSDPVEIRQREQISERSILLSGFPIPATPESYHL